MNETTLRKVKELTDALDKEDIHYAIVAGFGLDALKGELLTHGDVDMLVLKSDFDRIKEVLTNLGYEIDFNADLIRAKHPDGSEADLDMLTVEGDEAVMHGPNKITYFPKEMVDRTQIRYIEGVPLRIASNELLKLFGLWDRKGKYLDFAKNIQVNETLFNKIRRVPRNQASGED